MVADENATDNDTDIMVTFMMQMSENIIKFCFCKLNSDFIFIGKILTIATVEHQ